MSKMSELDLRKQEVVDECEEMRWENEGKALSDVQVRIVEYAFMQGFHAAGELVVRPMQENLVPDNDNQTVIEEIARVALGMVFDEIGHELDLSDEELLRVRDYLEAKEDEAVDAEVGEYVDTHQKDEQELKDIYSFIDGSEHPLEDFVKRKSEEKIKAKIQQEQDDE
jgi:hypothetical protein